MRTSFIVSLFVALLLVQDPVETIRIDSDLVDLKVSVLGFAPNTPAPLLEQKDFRVLEDGVEQEISFFAAADAPFDLVLLLDLSGSNSKNLKMIRNSAKRFVEAARDIDRIALVAFTDRPALYSQFGLDRRKLKKSIDEMDEAIGGTNFWDSLDYVLKDLINAGGGLRRTAIVVMTDGIDNALPDVPGPGSRTPFEKLVENIRNSESIVFPIYLDTEEENVKRYHVPRAAYAQAREQLGLIATTCGTTLYRAAKLKDLDTVYAQVVRDLSTVYSIGYRPTNKSLDGKWRVVQVQLVDRPELFARTKRGYHAKLSEPSQ
ncbi:MAG TPA: VWA domain-containing protein [Pyrinomonadaceae bacterium]|jgi:VWFA-related protein|nr:VWA domain-containing protein [Pyrinomonadaceae bacterium]